MKRDSIVQTSSLAILLSCVIDYIILSTMNFFFHVLVYSFDIHNYSTHPHPPTQYSETLFYNEYNPQLFN